MSNQQSVIDYGRHGYTKPWRGCGILFGEFESPFNFSGLSIMARKNSADPEGIYISFADNRCRLRAFAMKDRRRMHLVPNGLARAPDFFAVGGVQTQQHFVLGLSREHVNLSIGEDRRSMSQPNFNFEFLLKSLGPTRWKLHISNLRITIRSTELRPIRG